MNKYIRTKDGKILDTDKREVYTVTKNEHNAYDLKEGDKFLLEKGKIIKITDEYRQSDTIEELCDEVVLFDKDNVPHYKSKEGNIWYLGAGLFTESLRFGIFTDKGLIYVAKMNAEGELELL